MLKPGAILKKNYSIVRTLGKRGVSGCTYLVEHIGQGTYYAIKELEPNPSRPPEELQIICQRFTDESAYLSRLNGFKGQIPKFYESFKELDSAGVERQYIVQEYIDGPTLTQYLGARGGPLSEP